MAMRNKDFAVFILTHGRSGNIITLRTLERHGYTGRIYYIVDNEDKDALGYFFKIGMGNVITFNKKEYAEKVDEGNNFNNRKVILHARNACFDIAKKLKIKYFIQLDDDYGCFIFRINHKKEYPTGKFMIRGRIDQIFDILLDFYKSINAKSIAISQGGDWIGGGGIDTVYKFKRKAMNSFICSTDRPFKFIGSINEDVNTYVTLGSRGELFFTISFVSLTQAQTQSQESGMTDWYKRFGTYAKSFSTVMMHPSYVSVAMMQSKNKRLHHQISWRYPGNKPYQ